MIKRFVQFLGIETKTPASASSTDSETGTESVRHIIQSLEALEPERAHYIALFASILSRVAHADLNISPEESQAIEKIVKELGGLTQSQAVLVAEIAKQQNRLLGGVENYLITREFAKVASQEKSFQLLEALFAVAAAEAGISAEENQEINKIAEEIGLKRQDFLAVRAKFKEDLNVLKNIPTP